jgi:hypothetical protein
VEIRKTDLNSSSVIYVPGHKSGKKSSMLHVGLEAVAEVTMQNTKYVILVSNAV